MVHGAVLEVVVLLSVLVVAQYLELHTLLCNELCLDVVEEEGSCCGVVSSCRVCVSIFIYGRCSGVCKGSQKVDDICDGNGVKA